MTARRSFPRRHQRARGFLIGLAIAILVAAVTVPAWLLGQAWPLKESAATTPTQHGSVGSATETAATASTSPSATPSADPAPRLRLMSFNILTSDPIIYSRNPQVPRRELEFRARAAGIVAQITRADPDLVAIQENFGDPVPYAVLKAKLPAYAWVKPGEQVSILVRKARFDVLVQGYIDLHATEKGFLSWARLRDRSSGDRFWVFDVHLRSGATRKEALIRSVEADTLHAQMLKVNPGLAEPVVLMGDLNTEAGEQRPIFADPIRKITAGGFQDAATIAESDTSNVPHADSFHGFRAVVNGVPYLKVVRQDDVRIDFIFVPKGTEVFTFGVRTGPRVVRTVLRGKHVYRWQGIVPSDHSPVVAEITLKERKPR